MKIFCLFLCVVSYSFNAVSQNEDISTIQFTIFGLVDKPKVITLTDLKQTESVDIGGLKITNHLGEVRKEYKNIKGIPLVSLFKDVLITSTSPKSLSEYFLVIKAADSYSVVLSWNELFNSDIGHSFFIVTEVDGKNLDSMAERILMIATKDLKTGRRHVKGLESIEIKKN